MGYDTDFTGRFVLNKKLSTKMHGFLDSFNKIRHVKRCMDKYGWEGEFYVNGDESGVENPNDGPPMSQPNEWCQWKPTEDGMGIEWDGNEKFYDYVIWLKYIIVKFLKPNGYILTGTVHYSGEDDYDTGNITVVNNEIVSPRYPSGYQGEDQVILGPVWVCIKGSDTWKAVVRSKLLVERQPIEPPEPEKVYTKVPKRRILTEN